MPMDLETVLWELDGCEPNVIVDPSCQAFCLVRSEPPRVAPATPERIPLEVILRYMTMNAR